MQAYYNPENNLCVIEFQFCKFNTPGLKLANCFSDSKTTNRIDINSTNPEYQLVNYNNKIDN